MLLAVKFNEGVGNAVQQRLRSVSSKIESEFALPKSAVFRSEFGVFALLRFDLMPDDAELSNALATARAATVTLSP